MKFGAFFEKFEYFAEALDGLAKIRELVLHLAVTGKLVRQDPQEESADVLLAAARSERAKLVAAGKIKVRPAAPVELDEQPYGLPKGWEWARLSDVGHELGQKFPDKRFTYIDVGGIDSDKGRISRRVEELEPNDAPSRARKLVARGTVIYSTIRPYLLNVAVVDEDFEPEAIASTAFGILHPFSGIDNRYLFFWLRSWPFTAYVNAAMKGMAYPAINDERFYGGFIALPPLAEQKRIVAKADELTALCDRLESQQNERDMQHAALARASLSRFADAPTPANLNFLFHNSYTIPPADLRKSILTLAVQGKLVPHDPADEPAERILWRLAEGKREENKGTNAPTPLRSIEDRAKPFQLPSSWEWARLGDIADVKHGFAFSSELFTSEPSAFVLTTPGNFYEKGGFRDRGPKTKYYRGEVDPSFVFKPGDLIIPMTEQAAGLLGSPAFIPDDGKAYIHNQRLGKLRFYSDAILPKFAYWYFNSEFFRNELARTCTGMKVRHTSPRKVLSVPYPLCSLAEQRRIVVKVDRLMAIVDELEAQLAASRETAAKLLDAIVAALTGVSTGGTQ
jgi:type I restriction enzyme S subunit